MIFVLAMLYGVGICANTFHLCKREVNHQFEIECPDGWWGPTMTLMSILWPLYWAGRLLDVGTQKLLPPPGENP